MKTPKYLCMDFDGTIMRYDPWPDHFDPEIVAALNALQGAGVPWIANSGRTLDGQLEILTHTADAWGLEHWPVAILHGECYIHVRQGHDYVSLDDWNDAAHQNLRFVQDALRDGHKSRLDQIINDYAPHEVFFNETVAVFRMGGEEQQRQAFMTELQHLLADIPEAHLIQNTEWISIIHRCVGKGNLIKGYMNHLGENAADVLAIGDHGNDISMLDGSVTPLVACPGNAYEPTQRAVREAGGFIAAGPAAQGTLEAIHHFFPTLRKTLS